MVFSFFKKQPEKMVTRQPAVPRPSVDGKESPAAERKPKHNDRTASNVEAADDEVRSSMQFSNLDFRFTESSLDFQVSTEHDPVNESAEEAAILFADNQDKAAQTVLEVALKSSSGQAEQERLWMMLFDLYRLSGQQSAFEAMGIEYARVFEKSPPGWGSAQPASQTSPSGDSGGILFRGEIVATNTAAFEAVHRGLEKSASIRLDVSKVRQVDSGGSEQLLDLLVFARKEKKKIELRGRDPLIRLLQERVTASRDEPLPDKGCWLLLLELLQQKGQLEPFEETAIDYAVTFEESPPSWDAGRVTKQEPVVSLAGQENQESSNGDQGGYLLSGDIRLFRFSDVPDFAQTQEVLLFDCDDLRRIDFSSAGALLGVLSGVHNAGKPIIFRHPNYLIAELFRIVGLDAVATIINAKH